MRIDKPTLWERAQTLYDRAKLDLTIATGGAVFAGLATLDANFGLFASGRAFTTMIAYVTGGASALLGVRAGVRGVGAAAFAAIAGAQWLLKSDQGASTGAGVASPEDSSARARREASASEINERT